MILTTGSKLQTFRCLSKTSWKLADKALSVLADVNTACKAEVFLQHTLKYCSSNVVVDFLDLTTKAWSKDMGPRNTGP